MSVIKPALQRPDLIAYFSGANNYCWLYFRNGEKKLLAKPISYLESQLPSFIRVHKTVLINPTYVRSLRRPPRQKMAGEVQLNGGEVFPVSRRRWPLVAEALQEHLMPADSKGAPLREMVSDTLLRVASPVETTEQAIFLVTDDEQTALLTKQAIEKKWPSYPFYSAQRSVHLPDLFRQLPQQTLPILLLLDARTTTLERLHTLQRLKEDPRLSPVPVILFVTQTDKSVTDGYERKANSVISLPDRYSLLSETVERVCRFWLRTAALPGVGQ